jgi:hypothetical protein
MPVRPTCGSPSPPPTRRNATAPAAAAIIRLRGSTRVDGGEELQQGERLRDAGGCPHLAELFSQGGFVGRDERFEFGLQRLLDGVQAEFTDQQTR